MKKAMFERDILYPTQKTSEPGSVHVTVYPPKNSGGIPVVIEAKTVHNPSDYIPEIVEILQVDVFDRIRIDVKKCGILLFKAEQNAPYYRVSFSEKDKYSIEEIEEVDLLI